MSGAIQNVLSRGAARVTSQFAQQFRTLARERGERATTTGNVNARTRPYKSVEQEKQRNKQQRRAGTQVRTS